MAITQNKFETANYLAKKRVLLSFKIHRQTFSVLWLEKNGPISRTKV